MLDWQINNTPARRRRARCMIDVAVQPCYGGELFDEIAESGPLPEAVARKTVSPVGAVCKHCRKTSTKAAPGHLTFWCPQKPAKGTASLPAATTGSTGTVQGTGDDAAITERVMKLLAKTLPQAIKELQPKNLSERRQKGNAFAALGAGPPGMPGSSSESE